MSAASNMDETNVAGRHASPLFLVGMPRSGTKLLREMLNGHRLVRFSDIETDFLPYWVFKWRKLMPLPDPDGFRKFYVDCQELPFFIQNAHWGQYIDCDKWLGACDTFTPAGVFEGLMRCCLDIPRSDENTIWADKSPSYIRHIPLLMTQFPRARVVHIIRDVRDYGLSIRAAWGKNILRAAQRWEDDVSKARTDGQAYRRNYMEVRYEDLLAEPQRTLEGICVFLRIEFDERTINPRRVVENKGAAMATRGILRDNTKKYRTRMQPNLVSKIEQIACQTLRELGYACEYRGAPVRLPWWRLQLLQWLDGWHVISASVSRFGVIRSIRYNLKYFNISGNRR